MNDNVGADPVQVSVKTVTRARAKRFKEGLNGLIQKVWFESGSKTCAMEKDSKLINLVQVIAPSQESQGSKGSILDDWRCHALASEETGAAAPWQQNGQNFLDVQRCRAVCR